MEGTLKGKKLRFLKFLNKAETNLNYEKTDLKFEETDLKYEETDQFLSFWKRGNGSKILGNRPKIWGNQTAKWDFLSFWKKLKQI